MLQEEYPSKITPGFWLKLNIELSVMVVSQSPNTPSFNFFRAFKHCNQLFLGSIFLVPQSVSQSFWSGGFDSVKNFMTYFVTPEIWILSHSIAFYFNLTFQSVHPLQPRAKRQKHVVLFADWFGHHFCHIDEVTFYKPMNMLQMKHLN